MIYLTGVSTEEVVQIAQHAPIGIMLQPDSHYERLRQRYPCGWAVDNGCFAKGARFDVNHFLRWVSRLARMPEGCRFVVAPDVVANAAATLERSLPIMPLIRGMGLPVAFVAQDGLEGLDIPWGMFDVLFIGGSTDWKLSIQATWIVRQAKAEQKWVHMGRVNSAKRMRLAEGMGCDSCDGTFLKFGPDTNIPRLLKWFGKEAA